MNKSHLQFTRRGFLQTLSGWSAGCMAANCVGQSIVQTLVHGLFTKAYAESQSIDPKFFLDVYVGGGFHAPFFYLPLNPYGSQTAIFNTWIANQWTAGNPVYAPVAVSAAGETVNLSPVWGSTIPRHADWGGGMVPMSSLLSGTMFFRGFINAFDSHEVNSIQIARPDSSQPSIAGMIADRSSKPVPAVHLNNYRRDIYASKKVGAKDLYSGASTIDPLTSSFNASVQMRNLLDRRDAFKTAFDIAVGRVAADAKRVGAVDVLGSVASADALIRRNLGDLSSTFYALADKYSNLIKACGDMSQVFPEAISPSTNPADPTYAYRQWNSVAPSGTFLTNADLRSIVTMNTTNQALSDGFALAEFLMTQDLSNAVMFGMGGPGNLNLEYSSGSSDWTLDMHAQGIATGLVAGAHIGRSYAACLYEFSRRAQALGRQDKIVVKIGSEFSRSPRHDGSGADHASDANCMMVYSGAIKKPMVLGNIKQGSTSGTYRGTYGQGTTNTHEGSTSTILNMGHYASTLATMIGIPSPTGNFQGLVSIDSNQNIVAAVAKGETKS